MSCLLLPLPRRRDERTPWGEDIDYSPQVLWYGARWETIGEDEAVFLIPSLVAQRSPAGTGPAELLRRALAARIQWSFVHAGSQERSVFESLVDIVQLENVRAADLDAIAKSACHALYGPSRPSKNPAHEIADRETELVILRCLDRALGAAADRPTVDPVTAVSLDEAILVSIHSGLNAAYVWDLLAARHETLMVAAWLGHLTRGRAAYLMPAIADPLDELVRSESSDAALIRHYAQWSMSTTDLRKAPGRVIATGRSMLIHPLQRTANVTLPLTQPLKEWARARPDMQAVLSG
jgi:hypothetical protein